VNLEKEVLPEKLGAFLATFGPGLVADRFVAAVTDPSSADVALTMLTVGVPVLLSIDAVTPSASFDRLFHLLSRPNLGIYQGFTGTGLEREHLLQVHVQLAQPGWGSLGYVSEVHVLADVAKQSGPALVQVVTADTTRSRRTWTHSARIEDGALRFESPDHTAPTSLRTRLADVPEEIWEHWRSEPLQRPATSSCDPALRPYRQLLRDARALFEAGDFAAAAEQLESAAAMNTDRSLEELADDLLASDVCQLLDQHVAETAAAITAALDAGEGEQAAALLEAPTNVLVERARTRSQPWQTLALRLGVMRAAFGTCQERLQAVREAEEQGDLRRAYAIATSIRTAFLLPELQRKLLLLRQSQLQSLLAQLDKTAAAEVTYRAALAQIERDFIALQPHGSYANATTSQQTTNRMPVLADSPDPTKTPPSPQAMEKASGAPGWLDAALARNRERRHQQPGEQEARGE
jgi:hypothetical protein